MTCETAYSHKAIVLYRLIPWTRVSHRGSLANVGNLTVLKIGTEHVITSMVVRGFRSLLACRL